MSPDRDKEVRSSEVAKAIAQMTARALKLPSPEVAAAFDDLENRLVRDIAEESENVEVRRRICEARISIFAKRSDSVSEFHETWNRLEHLGYSDIEREATMLFYRVGFLLKNTSDKKLTATAINRLKSLLSQFSPDANSLSSHFARVYENLQDEFSKKYF